MMLALCYPNLQNKVSVCNSATQEVATWIAALDFPWIQSFESWVTVIFMKEKY